jgi:hypothetical protein
LITKETVMPVIESCRVPALVLVAALMVAFPAGAQTQLPGNTAPGDTQSTGSEPPQPKTGPTGDTSANAPIGSGPETTPAKTDENVAARDRIPIMARPLPLTDEQKRQIYSSVMERSDAPVTQTTAQPATILPGSVHLSELPAGIEDQIPAVRGFKYVKLADKVLLVSPSNRVVVGEIQR